MAYDADQSTIQIPQAAIQILDMALNGRQYWMDGEDSGDDFTHYILRFEVGGFNRRRSYLYQDDEVGSFEVGRMPGCCGVMILSGLTVEPGEQKRGVGAALCMIAESVAREDGYTVLLATDIIDNPPMQKLFRRGHWLKLADFNNRRTGNDVGVYMKNLLQPPAAKRATTPRKRARV